MNNYTVNHFKVMKANAKEAKALKAIIFLSFKIAKESPDTMTEAAADMPILVEIGF